jgi:hypothetical protein
MNTFARASIAFAAALTASASSAIEIPAAPDCRAMAAAHPGGSFWRGTFSGTYEDFFDRRQMIYVEGCFETEYLCRRWINQVQTAVINPGLMRCRPLVGR